MPRGPASVVGFALAVAAALGSPSSASAQPTISYTFDASGFYTASRQAAIQAAGTYAASQLDFRGTIVIDLDSQNLGTGNGATLAFAGTNYSYFQGTGSATNGSAFTQATTNSPPYQFQLNSGTFNNAINWY